MKYRESGMPPEKIWNTFFSPIDVLKKMDITQMTGMVMDIGCGYGTFLLPIAELSRSRVIGIDIDPEMIEICRNKITAQNAAKIELIQGDISSDDTPLEIQKYKGEIDYIALFNMLHCEEPARLFKHVYELLKKGGKAGVIHWVYDRTPRGPSMDIRPEPQIIMEWAGKAGFVLKRQVELPPFHYGLVFLK